ncbi:MAG: RimK domain-containing protein ATP-grasp [Thermoproteota archaeon]|nr:RimK domain-containing protein ATP-grasp [Thermoproteota archaeon]
MTLILLLGTLEDNTLLTVYDALKRSDTPVLFVDQKNVSSATIELELISGNIAGFLEYDNETIELKTITGAYIRPYSIRQLFDDINDDLLQKFLKVNESLSSWAELTSALVLNRPSAMASNNSKPYQLMKIRSFGFEIPETFITTDPNSALAFWQKYRIVVYKSISSIRSIVSRLSQQHIDRLKNVIWCPTQFQRYIPGVNFRAHVIGDKVFACQILSNADDYRYPKQQGENVEIIPSDLPQNISYRCKTLTNELGLTVSGIDLKFTSEGKWYCFEVNPSPAFNYYQGATKQPIDEAIVDLLKSSNAIDYPY